MEKKILFFLNIFFFLYIYIYITPTNEFLHFIFDYDKIMFIIELCLIIHLSLF